MNSLLESPVIISSIVYCFAVFITVLVPFEETVKKRVKHAIFLFIGLYILNVIFTLSTPIFLLIFSSLGTPFVATAILQYYESRDWEEESKIKDFTFQKVGQLVYKAISASSDSKDIPMLVTQWAEKLTKADPEHADSYRDIITTFIV